LRRNTNDWIARIFSIAAAGATPTWAGCSSRPLCIEEIVDGSAKPCEPPPSPPSEPFPHPTVRRPFFVGGSLRAASPAARDDWLQPLAPAEGLDPATCRALAAAWLKDALEEHASVAAFARFSIQALEAGAPWDIVADAQRAALDEVRHARICFGLAARYGATSMGPGPLRVDGAFSASSLAEFAALTAEEGCVGETLGALLAERQAEVAAEPIVKKALTRIARDERRHAELAWRFVAWARRTGGSSIAGSVAEAIRGAVAATRAMVVRALDVDLDGWHAHGRLTCAESRQVAEEGIAEIVLPALAVALFDPLE
jgi:hypothetical protein